MPLSWRCSGPGGPWHLLFLSRTGAGGVRGHRCTRWPSPNALKSKQLAGLSASSAIAGSSWMWGAHRWWACSSEAWAPPPAPQGPECPPVMQVQFSHQPHSVPVSALCVLTPHRGSAVSQGVGSGSKKDGVQNPGTVGVENAPAAAKKVCRWRTEGQERWHRCWAGSRETVLPK